MTYNVSGGTLNLAQSYYNHLLHLYRSFLRMSLVIIGRKFLQEFTSLVISNIDIFVFFFSTFSFYLIVCLYETMYMYMHGNL